MSEEKKQDELEFAVDPISEEDLEDVSAGMANCCESGSGCSDGIATSPSDDSFF